MVGYHHNIVFKNIEFNGKYGLIIESFHHNTATKELVELSSIQKADGDMVTLPIPSQNLLLW